ncbi:MAG TPA: zinc ABC transporter substrate-binding protein [Thermomicrobiales bacterium]|jgi:manganese/zinc/iron transport system substrate-binding protein|nr:zinc ABC transporter substrate-binding protein [Thermomicrobiales bacterium]
MTRRALLGAAGFGVAATLSGCGVRLPGPERNPRPPGPWLTVVATTPILGDLVRSLAGSRVTVRTMMPPTADPLRFIPGPSASDVLVDADLVIQHGMGLEPGLAGLIEAAVGEGIPVVTATEDLPAGAAPLTVSGAPDPYIWHDPASWPWVVSRVHRALLDHDDDELHRRIYDSNATQYLGAVGRLDAYATRILGTVPQERRLLVTADATFGWLGRRFGFETIALVDPSIPYPDDALIGRFADTLIQRRPATAFPDAAHDPLALRVAVERAAGASVDVPVGPLLYGSGLALGGEYAGRYLGMVRQNVDRIALALGQAPPPVV